MLTELFSDPVAALICALVLAVAVVNGWTDAPNAIATAVCTGALSFRRAVGLAAVCNLLGLVCVTAVNSSVAETLFTIAEFGAHTQAARSALCAGLCAVVLWATAAWRFGIPTSESHALAAAVTGAALALPRGTVHTGPWGKILLGLVLSVGLGWFLGRLCTLALNMLRPSPTLCRRGQVGGAAAMAFLHGAQDGQKCLGILLLGLSLAEDGPTGPTFSVPLEAALLCAAFMATGTALGGGKIIDTVGREMVCLEPRQGLAADLGGGVCLMLCTLLGLPVSTTHAKTAAILGAGSRANRRVAGQIVLTWLFTFPGCGLLGFFLARLFLFGP